MIMKNSLLSLAAFCVVATAAVASVAAAEPPVPPVKPAAAKPEQLAQIAAEQWLTLVDAGKFAESWQAASAYFKGAVSEAQWKTALDGVRKPLGALVTRKFKSAKPTQTVPGAPDGAYVILQFETTFANKKDAIETVTPMLDKDSKWKVSGYFIK
jgi:hypothetical protein